MTESVVNTPHNPVTTHGTDSNGKVAPMGATTDSSGAPAGNAVVANLAEQLQLYTPSRDVFLDFFHGTDDAVGTLTVDNDNVQPPIDVRELHPDSRTIVILGENAAPVYAYSVSFSRSGLVADAYAVITEAEAAQDQNVIIPLPFATYGYDQYVHLILHPAIGEAGTELQFTSYLTGRGG